MSRQQAVERIERLVGPPLSITDPADGWPALGSVRTVERTLPVALFVGLVGLSHRGRDQVERRFQNPGQDRPIQPPAERLPLLIGLWEGDDLHSAGSPVLVAGDPDRRVGRATRFSVFVELAALLVAASTGWAETTSSSGERIVCLRPPSLPVLAEARDLGVSVSADRARFEIAQEEADPAPRHERRWRTTTTLVRATRFSKEVRDQYGGLCAMCGLGLGLVESAHIVPASAPDSTDEAWNGLALCANHHKAFDHHLIWVDPESREIALHDDLREARVSPAHACFISTTFPALAEPRVSGAQPRAEAFVRRYRLFSDEYSWAPH